MGQEGDVDVVPLSSRAGAGLGGWLGLGPATPFRLVRGRSIGGLEAGGLSPGAGGWSGGAGGLSGALLMGGVDDIMQAGQAYVRNTDL